jgi:hypothetical protein
MVVQCKPLNVITMVRNPTDNINRMIIIAESTSFDKNYIFSMFMGLKDYEGVHQGFYTLLCLLVNP